MPGYIWQVVVVVAVVVLPVAIVLVDSLLARRRIRREIAHRGGYVKRIDWMPFSYGKRYRVSYVDGSDIWHIAQCSATFLSLVWHEDRTFGSDFRQGDDDIRRMSS
ncbi:MAG: hypothetical protein JXL80_05565 [Planctomycetes bacterium]|nr:hypothetical protein [Planctomycetota bacterium]